MREKRLVVAWLLIMNMVGSAYALKVERRYDFHTIEPKSVADMHDIMSQKSSIAAQNKALGTNVVSAKYRWKIEFLERIHYKENVGKCTIEANEPLLKGTVEIYTLDENGVYSIPIINVFEKIYEESHQHELKHEAITKDAFIEAERAVDNYIKNHQDNCLIARKQIEAIFKMALKKNVERNQLFDCKEYGYQLNISTCKKKKSLSTEE